MTLLVREATPADAALIAELTRNCWADKIAPSSSGHHEASQRVTDDLQNGGGFILLRAGLPVGSIRWLPLAGDASVREILRMGVLPDYRGERLSQHLMHAAIQHAQAAKVKELRLAVRVDQPQLLAMYTSFRFAPAPDLKYSHANPAEPAPVVMRRRLQN